MRGFILCFYHISCKKGGTESTAELCLLPDHNRSTDLLLQRFDKTFVFGYTAGHHIFPFAADTLYKGACLDRDGFVETMYNVISGFVFCNQRN